MRSRAGELRNKVTQWFYEKLMRIVVWVLIRMDER